jgi:hypothetical protein
LSNAIYPSHIPRGLQWERTQSYAVRLACSKSREECTAITQLCIAPGLAKNVKDFAITFWRYAHILIVYVSDGNGLLAFYYGVYYGDK